MVTKIRFKVKEFISEQRLVDFVNTHKLKIISINVRCPYSGRPTQHFYLFYEAKEFSKGVKE